MKIKSISTINTHTETRWVLLELRVDRDPSSVLVYGKENSMRTRIFGSFSGDYSISSFSTIVHQTLRFEHIIRLLVRRGTFFFWFGVGCRYQAT